MCNCRRAQYTRQLKYYLLKRNFLGMDKDYKIIYRVWNKTRHWQFDCARKNNNDHQNSLTFPYSNIYTDKLKKAKFVILVIKQNITYKELNTYKEPEVLVCFHIVQIWSPGIFHFSENRDRGNDIPKMAQCSPACQSTCSTSHNYSGPQ